MHQTLPDQVDTVVVGGGTGGAALTRCAGRAQLRTLLLVEAGPDYGPRDRGGWPADVLDARAIPLSHDCGLAGAQHARPRARPAAGPDLGGCSSHNGCTASLAARADYDDWARRGNPGWACGDVEPPGMGPRPVPGAPLQNGRADRAQVAFVLAGLAVGLPFAETSTTSRPAWGSARCPSTSSTGSAGTPGSPSSTRSGAAPPEHRRPDPPSGSCCQERRPRPASS